MTAPTQEPKKNQKAKDLEVKRLASARESKIQKNEKDREEKRLASARQLDYKLLYNPPRFDQVTSFSNLMSSRVKKPLGGSQFKEFGYEKGFLRSLSFVSTTKEFVDPNAQAPQVRSTRSSYAHPDSHNQDRQRPSSRGASRGKLLTAAESIYDLNLNAKSKTAIAKRPPTPTPIPMISKHKLASPFGYRMDMLPYLYLEKELCPTRRTEDLDDYDDTVESPRPRVSDQCNRNENESFEEFTARMNTRPDGSKICIPTVYKAPRLSELPKRPLPPAFLKNAVQEFEMTFAANKKINDIDTTLTPAQLEAQRMQVAKLEPVFPTVSKSLKVVTKWVKFADYEKDREHQLLAAGRDKLAKNDIAANRVQKVQPSRPILKSTTRLLIRKPSQVSFNIIPQIQNSKSNH